MRDDLYILLVCIFTVVVIVTTMLVLLPGFVLKWVGSIMVDVGTITLKSYYAWLDKV